MRNQLVVALLVGLAGGWPGLAHGVEFPPQGSGPPMSTSPSGFVGVPGPGEYAPERFQAFPPPPPTPPAQASACPTCPVSGPAQGQDQAPPAQR